MFAKIIVTMIVAFVSYFLGVFGWAQIIGSFQHWKVRGTKASIITITLWSVILAAATLAVVKWLRAYLLVYGIVMGIALIMILGSGKMR